MNTDFPLWRLRPEEAARIILLAPVEHVPQRRDWHKREQRLKPSNPKVEPDILKGARWKPRNDDMRRLALARPNHRGDLNSYWREAFAEHGLEFPVIGVLAGPLLWDGQFYSQSQQSHVRHPLSSERERPPFEIYSRAQFERDVERFEAARALVRENFILGQQKEGPLMDGLIYMRIDNLLLAEIEHCKARLRATWAILEAKNLEKLKVAAKTRERDIWEPIGKDESIALQFKHSGHTVRNTGMGFEVLVNQRRKSGRT